LGIIEERRGRRVAGNGDVSTSAAVAAAADGSRRSDKGMMLVSDLIRYTRHGHYKEVERILSLGVAVDARDQFGNSALTVACQNGNKRIAKMLLRQGADINQQNSKGNSPMHYCFAFGYAELGEYLISKGTTTQ
jgi:ankyrin repeat protein